MYHYLKKEFPLSLLKQLTKNIFWNSSEEIWRGSTQSVWPDGEIIFSKLYNNEKLPLWPIVCQSNFNIMPNTQKTLKHYQRIYKFCQSGDISPNLVADKKLFAVA